MITCSISTKRQLCYKTFDRGSSYSTAYNSYNFCHRSKLLAVLKLPVNCLLWSWYSDTEYASNAHQMKLLKINDSIGCNSQI